MKLIAALAAASALALGGCAVSAERAEEHAQAAAASQCADQGHDTFVQTGGEAASNGAVAAATARGHCADTAEEPPPPPPGP